MVQANWLFTQGIMQMLAGDRRTPFVITCHGSDINMMKAPLITHLKKRALKTAWGVTCVFEDLRGTVDSILQE